MSLAFFFVGEAYFDPSGEHGLATESWFVNLQWLAIVAPVGATWLVFKLLALSPKK
jgi:hypothetical protein